MRKLFVALLVGGCLAALPAQALGTIAFVRYKTISSFPDLWVMNDDGSGKTKLTKGNTPIVSPDGMQIAFIKAVNSPTVYRQDLYVIPSAGGTARRLVKNVQYGTATWSPDSQSVTAAVGVGSADPPKQQKLLIVNVSTAQATQVTTTKGIFEGISFSPDGTQLVYGATKSSTAYPSPADVYRATLTNGEIANITNNGRSTYPLWGPQQKIVYVRFKNRKNNAPVYNLFTMNFDGSESTQLTHMKARNLVSGLTPVAFSIDGSRLAANYVGQDTFQGYSVNMVTGAVKNLGKKSFDGTAAFGISADGQKVLVQTQAFEPTPDSVVGTVPFEGGAIHTLTKNASQPSWNVFPPSPLPL